MKVRRWPNNFPFFIYQTVKQFRNLGIYHQMIKSFQNCHWRIWKLNYRLPMTQWLFLLSLLFSPFHEYPNGCQTVARKKKHFEVATLFFPSTNWQTGLVHLIQVANTGGTMQFIFSPNVETFNVLNYSGALCSQIYLSVRKAFTDKRRAACNPTYRLMRFGPCFKTVASEIAYKIDASLFCIYHI